MANTYKSIGNTAAAVVSLLAIGTLCWWQRPVTPINAPRPQDEAEIMTAVLERHYAMGRTNTYYGTERLAYISTVLTTLVSTVVTNIGGTNTTLYVTNPATVYITNSPALILTNTIGFFPNAPFRLASGLRAAFIGKNTAQSFSGWRNNPAINLQKWRISAVVATAWTPRQQAFSVEEPNVDNNRMVGWIVPDDTYMDSGDLSWFGNSLHTNIFSAPLNYWTGTSWGNYADTYFSRPQFVWTNYVTKSTATWTTLTNYTASYVTNRVIGVVTNTVTNTFRSTTNYIVTTEMNTYVKKGQQTGEAVAMMLAYERDSATMIRCDDFRFGLAFALSKYRQPFFSTNTYRDMGRALSLLQWIRDYRQPTTYVSWTVRYTNGLQTELSSTTGFAVVSPSVSDYFYIRTAPPVTTNSWAFGTTVLYDFTNTLPFAVDKVTFTPTGFLTNGVTPVSWGSGPGQIASVAPGASGSGGWWPCDPNAMRDYLIAWASANDGNQGPGPVLSMTIPYDCYHVQFSALTNYMDHAPAR